MNNDMADSDKHILDGKMSGVLERWRWRMAAENIKAGDAVLDVACNEGGLISYLPTNVTYMGIDISETALRYARKHHPDYQFVMADLSKTVPDVQQFFDVAIMLAFIEHLQEPEHILRAVKSLLKPNGRIVITTPSPWARPVHEVGAKLGVFSQEGAEDHETFFGKKAIKHLASLADLKVATFRYFMYGFNQLIILEK